MLKPGGELDALVAEKVMGWRWFTDEFNTRPVLIPPGMPQQCATPHYSTDIAAAWAVVEKLGERFRFEIRNHEGYDWNVYVRPWDTRISMSGESVTKENLPHAICLAALKAVGADDPKT